MTKSTLLEIIKSYEQKDYKTGGVSIPPENYDALVNEIFKNDKSVLPNEIVECCDCGDEHKHSKRVGEFSEGVTYYLCPKCSGENFYRVNMAHELWNHLYDHHGITLTSGEIEEIEQIVITNNTKL